MFKRNPGAIGPDLFVSAKTATAIPARHPALREALVQSSLDPAVRSIIYIPSTVVASEPVDLDAVILQRDDGRYLLDVVPARKIRDIEDEGLALIAFSEQGLLTLTVTAEDLRREPRYANARLVWSYNGILVPIGLRMGILQLLVDDGPMQLGRLLKGIRTDRDPTPAVLALACADLLELDLLSRPLGPATMVGARS
ncbi:hypothetical protein [Bradyrhizobium sp. 62]|uniref:hypothetical protein n=1 Tax=Bradyrhizobium sp. 62 TaxID=1043588 RepID=UPI001FF7A6A5|nr:hypothetical protein [Bradyrhizobium sp. 62]MCK1365178.1 hypothetical protein [Bradyrhizobium sp. 62]